MAEKLKLEVSDEIAIKVESMNKWFGSFHVLRDILNWRSSPDGIEECSTLAKMCYALH